MLVLFQAYLRDNVHWIVLELFDSSNLVAAIRESKLYKPSSAAVFGLVAASRGFWEV